MKRLTKISVLFIGVLILSVSLLSARAASSKIALGSIELSQDTFVYTGEECRPEFVVYDVDGNIVDPANYTCEYIGAVNAGNENTKVYVKANDDSEYKGGLRQQFFINPAPISEAVVEEIPDYVYSGSSIKPTPEITYLGKKLTSGTDYVLFYENNKYAGTATVSIKGSADVSEEKKNKNFTGEISVKFEINPLSIESGRIEPIADKSYTGSAITPGIQLILDGVRLSSARYKLTYTNNVNAGTATVTATGVGDYCGTLTAKFTILPKQVTPSITLSATKFSYDGTVKKPKVKSVTYGTEKIKLSSSDYTVKYSSGCKNAGTYKVTVTLKGNFKGSNSKSFIIAPKAVSGAKVVLSKRTYTYSGKACKPSVTVTLDGKTLKKGTDYKVIYSSNKNPGNGKVQIEGIGNYSGKAASVLFLIRKDIQKFRVSAKAENFKLSYSKLQKAAQKLTAAKTLKISDSVGKISYSIGYMSGGKFSIDESTGTITVGKGTKKGTYELTLRLCAEGNTYHMMCYRLVDISVTVK